MIKIVRQYFLLTEKDALSKTYMKIKIRLLHLRVKTQNLLQIIPLSRLPLPLTSVLFSSAVVGPIRPLVAAEYHFFLSKHHSLSSTEPLFKTLEQKFMHDLSVLTCQQKSSLKSDSQKGKLYLWPVHRLQKCYS